MDSNQYIEDLKARDVSLRISAAKALRWIGDKDAIGALVGALGDVNEGVRFQCMKSLRSLAGQDFGEDASAWEKWFRENR